MTEEAFTPDGWFKTGDIGQISKNCTLKIIDRKKNIFKLQQGVYIAPEKLENIYLKCPMIDQIFVHGDSLQNFLVAIVTLNVEIVKEWADKNEMSIESVYDSQLLEDYLKGEFDEIADKNGLNSLERIKMIYISREKFTVENDLLTPTLKMK